jgi:putative aldouronate transport system permease protein
MSTKTVKASSADRRYDIFNNTLLILMFLVVFYPLLYVVACSFSSVLAIYSAKVWFWPVGFNVEAYKQVLSYPPILTGYKNTIIYTFVGTLINIFVTLCAGYPLSRKDLKGRNIIMFLFTFTMIFNGGLIPTYLVVRNLGMLNTRWAMLIPPAMSVYNVIITRTFFQSTIPDDLLDAAKIDGASDMQFIWHVVIPLSGAIIAVISLFYAVEHWNAFFNAFIYLSNQALYPLQIFLRDLLIMNEESSGMTVDPKVQQAMAERRELLKYALIVVSSAPILCMYPFIQKYFVKGVMIGAIKG